MKSKIDEQAAAEHIHGICLKTGPPRRVGVEIEWLVRDARNPAIAVSAERIADAMSGFAAAPGLPTSSSPGVLPSGAPLTTEPGGQLELSSLPADSLADSVRATVATSPRCARRPMQPALSSPDSASTRSALRAACSTLPRYAAMEAFFDRGGPWGRQMMCTTASIQVCLDAGDDSDGDRPATATGGGWCTRSARCWWPRSRTRRSGSGGRPAGCRRGSRSGRGWTPAGPGRRCSARTRARRGPVRARRAAHVRPQRGVGGLVGAGRADAPGLGARRRRRPDARRPTAEDLDYHLSTLFPPVRPHGHLELRMIDAQPGDGWIVPLAVATALFGDDRAGDDALAAVERLWAGHRPAMAAGPAGREPVAARGPARAGRPGHRRGQPGVLRGGQVGA